MNILLPSAVALTATLAIAVPAQAAVTGVHTSEKSCTTEGDVTFCVSNRFVYKETTTPSGNTLLTVNGYYQSFSEPSGDYTTRRYREQYVLKSDGTQVVNKRSTFIASYDILADRMTCTYNETFRFVNGKFLADDPETITCE